MKPLFTEAAAAQAIADTRANQLTYLIVASATADGTGRAVKCLHSLELGQIDAANIQLVVVRDGRGPMPVAARARLRLLSSVVAGITSIPHVLGWRYETLEQASRSPRFDAAVDRLARRITGDCPIPNFRNQQIELALGDD